MNDLVSHYIQNSLNQTYIALSADIEQSACDDDDGGGDNMDCDSMNESECDDTLDDVSILQENEKEDHISHRI